MTEQINDGRRDFDFFMGEWKVHNRRLRERLKGCTDWEEFEATCKAFPILGGLGNFDEITLRRESGDHLGATIRLFNPKTQEWSIYWSSNQNPALDLPMVGGFKDGHGEFYAHEPFEGKMIFSRFIWTVFDQDHCRWEQAFSPDGGRTWETNWTMDNTRVE